ncbi:DUF4394 domain-containing protein [Ancylobacter dichloromethanicus]
MKSSMIALTFSAFTFTGLALAAGGAQAQSVAALLDGNRIAVVDIKAAKVGTPMTVAGEGRLVGIDVRPADGRLYGLFEDGTVVTIDTASGKAMKKSPPSAPCCRPAPWRPSTSTRSPTGCG